MNLNVFTNIILACIVFSSITLAIEDPINENRNGFINDVYPPPCVGGSSRSVGQSRIHLKVRRIMYCVYLIISLLLYLPLKLSWKSWVMVRYATKVLIWETGSIYSICWSYAFLFCLFSQVQLSKKHTKSIINFHIIMRVLRWTLTYLAPSLNH